ncbi:zinc ribbon domain-containing protein [Thermodesulfobacteriota bacterium]
MKCTNCEFENPERAKFCAECGNLMEFHCPKCGAITLATGKFCVECGHRLSPEGKQPPKDLSFEDKLDKIQRYLPKGLTEKILSQRDKIEGERKQVTVMFCDMEGFTALSERIDPEEAYAIMDEVYEILIHKVHDYEGTVNEMTGDGIVALFGAPIALEDAPQRAIRSAHAIHREMVRFNEKMILLESHDYRKAMAHISKAISILEDSKAWQCELEFNRILLALAMVMNGDKGIELKPLFDYASGNRVKYLDGWMHKFIAMILLNIDNQHLDEAENWITKAIEADDGNGMRFNLGQDYAVYSELFKRKGDLPKAREHLSKAIDIMKECSADGWAAMYEEELAGL